MHEMSLVQDDHMIETLATNTPNQALHIRILPGAPWSNKDLLDAHMFDLLSKGCAIDTVPVAEQRPWCLLPGKRFDHLVRCPHRRRVFRDVEMHHAAALVGEDHEHEEHAKRHGWHGEEIERDLVLRVGLEESLPRRGWWL